jgi:hypothetical protein
MREAASRTPVLRMSGCGCGMGNKEAKGQVKKPSMKSWTT